MLLYTWSALLVYCTVYEKYVERLGTPSRKLYAFFIMDYLSKHVPVCDVSDSPIEICLRLPKLFWACSLYPCRKLPA
jgi:hypothetical protein